MTTVLAAVDSDLGIWIGSDTLTNHNDRKIVGAEKVLRLPAGDGEVLLAVCGDGALAHLSRAHLKIDGTPDGRKGNADLWASAVASAFTDIARDGGITENGRLDGSGLLGWNGRLWLLAHHQAIPLGQVDAIGSGQDYALGAFTALSGTIETRAAVSLALQVACELDPHSGGRICMDFLPASKTLYLES